MANAESNLVSNARFLASLVPALLLLGVFFALIALVASSIGGMTGGLLGAVAGGSFVFAVLLAYWNAVDWLNLRRIRRARQAVSLRDGEIVAMEGVVAVDGPPLTAPFTGAPCAAYTYQVSYSAESASRGGRTETVLAQGFHLQRALLDGSGRRLVLGALPGFETDLRHEGDGTTWGPQARALFERLAPTARAASEREREARLLSVRRTDTDTVHEDYLMGTLGPNTGPLVIEEEVLPVGQPVCVIGTYDEARQRLVPRRSMLGPDLMVYRGTADDVVARVSRDMRGYVKAVGVLLGITVLIVGGALAL